MGIRRDAHGLRRVGLLGVPSPDTPILHRIRTPGVGCATGSPADFGGLGVTFVVLPAVGHLRRFIGGPDRSPDWFRLLLGCLGRAGRHRRTGGNRSVPSLIPPVLDGCLPLQSTD